MAFLHGCFYIFVFSIFFGGFLLLKERRERWGIKQKLLAEDYTLLKGKCNKEKVEIFCGCMWEETKGKDRKCNVRVSRRVPLLGCGFGLVEDFRGIPFLIHISLSLSLFLSLSLCLCIEFLRTGSSVFLFIFVWMLWDFLGIGKLGSIETYWRRKKVVGGSENWCLSSFVYCKNENCLLGWGQREEEDIR